MTDAPTEYKFWEAKKRGEDPDPPADRTEMPLGFWRRRVGVVGFSEKVTMRRLRVFLAATGTAFAVLLLCVGAVVGIVAGMNWLTAEYGSWAAVTFFVFWLSVVIGAAFAFNPRGA